MAPKVQLLYFDGYGRAEIIRIILNYGGIPFEDKRVTWEEWPQIKPSKKLLYIDLIHNSKITLTIINIFQQPSVDSCQS